ncbi:glutamate synthase large subunit, partial [Xanthovirga aplysinae]|uniref:glutamate synthase large subunit n=1 Tax=Xanthovirga aplysinae TaxID=2529853 RepID=UPI0012BBD503
ANIENVPSRQITLDAITALGRMIHRGAVAADGLSGDGCGFLFSIPDQFFRRISQINGFDLSNQYAIGMMFIKEEKHKNVFNEVCEKHDLKVLFYREVPVDISFLGAQAKDVLPEIVQAFVAPDSLMAARRFSELLYLVRKETENRLKGDEDFYIASLSDKVISYKGLLMPQYIQNFFYDLQEDDFAVSFVLFHQRFSTNTLPRWSLAQPFRTAAHNGEINSIKANRINLLAHTENLKSRVYSEEELRCILPIVEEDGSDSASIDNVFEFLVTNGVDFFKAVRSLVPAPWQNAPHMDAQLRAFYEYTAGNFEAWDGPAALNFTDGRYLGTVLDRNGLRPVKYIITKDNRLMLSSEFGVVDVDDDLILEQGRLKSGEMIGVDLKYGIILKNEEINDFLKESRPYNRWLNENSVFLVEHIDDNYGDHSDYYYENLVELQRYHNYTNEVLQQVIQPLLEKGKEETGSMGDDTPLACFSEKSRNFSDFFRQKFAQVTNPPIDPLREKVVMSTSVSFGATTNILRETSENAHKIRSMTPLLSKERLDVLESFGTPGSPLYDPNYKGAYFSTAFKKDLQTALKTLGERVVNAVKNDQVHLVYLDDRGLTEEMALIPMPMAVGYLNQLLTKKGLRSKITLVVITGEVMDSHSLAVLISFGAIAVYPYLFYASILQLIERKGLVSLRDKRLGLKKAHNALIQGILKIMSKMGISTLRSYYNSALFDVIGLSKEMVEDCFLGAYPLIPGLTYADIEERIRSIHQLAFKSQRLKMAFPLEAGGFYKYTPGGEYHDFSPDLVHDIHQFARNGGSEDYEPIRDRVNRRGLRMIRDFFNLNSNRSPVSLEEVEPASEIMKRFASAAMSLGSISPEAHEAIAEAMNTIGGMSNSGEGGEDLARRAGTLKNSRIKQVASGRFGVTPAYLRSADEIQIKVAQGAKPGEGGQLPGTKVSPLIASLRCTIPGVTLISPPPHHDIYSIEDLAQLIFDLKQVNPKAQVSVKLVSSVGVGTIAVGVAKAYADKIIISGADGGTGAAQVGSIKFAGNPWEPGLLEAHHALKVNNLRGNVELQTDGGLKTGLDVVKAAIFGAESYGFGTVLLSMVGCKILRVCHLNKCSVGIATQDKQLRTHYKGTVQAIVNYLNQVAEEVRETLASLGYTKLNDIIGQSDLLSVVENSKANKFDFASLLIKTDGDNIRTIKRNEPFDDNAFEKNILHELKPIIRHPNQRVILKKHIVNTNRSFGALISGEIAQYYGDEGIEKDHIQINLKGTAGQSLGAFLIQGMYLRLKGTANDYVGKGMKGGRIVIVPENRSKSYSLAGNTCLYGATGGKLFVAGQVGERFAVRNSGALAVVEGTGDHPCEYMTGGTVVILGETGINFGAGMTGGVAFVYDIDRRFTDRMNQELIKKERIDMDEMDEARFYLKQILQSYYFRTKSPKAKLILDNFRQQSRYFWMVTSKDMSAPLNPMEGH